MYDIYCCDANSNPIDHFTQWDTNVEFYIKNWVLGSPSFHFCNKNSERATVVRARAVSDGSGNTYSAIVPNDLLEEATPITIYLYISETATAALGGGANQTLTEMRTAATIRIPVRARVKPDDWTYTPNQDVVSVEEIYNDVQTLQNDVDSLEIQMANWVNQYASVDNVGVIKLHYGISGGQKVNRSGIVVDETDGTAYIATNASYGTQRSGSGTICTAAATTDEIAEQLNSYKPIVPSTLSYAVQTIGGDLTDLDTTDKTSYVAAINEIESNLSTFTSSSGVSATLTTKMYENVGITDIAVTKPYTVSEILNFVLSKVNGLQSHVYEFPTAALTLSYPIIKKDGMFQQAVSPNITAVLSMPCGIYHINMPTNTNYSLIRSFTIKDENDSSATYTVTNIDNEGEGRFLTGHDYWVYFGKQGSKILYSPIFNQQPIPYNYGLTDSQLASVMGTAPGIYLCNEEDGQYTVSYPVFSLYDDDSGETTQIKFDLSGNVYIRSDSLDTSGAKWTEWKKVVYGTNAYASVDIDSELNSTSSNPVQNKAITAELLNLRKEVGLDTCSVVVTQIAIPNDDTSYGDVQYIASGTWSNGQTFNVTGEQMTTESDLGSKIWLLFTDYTTVDMVVQWTNESDGSYSSSDEPIVDEYIYVTTAEFGGTGTTSQYPNISVDSDSISAQIANLDGSGSSGGSSVTVDTSITSTSTNPVTSKAIYTALNNKADVTRYASASQAGLIKLQSSSSGLVVSTSDGTAYVNTNTAKGTQTTSSNEIATAPATTTEITALSNEYKPIVPSTLKHAVQTIGGTLTDLETTAQSSYVAAINELKAAQTTGGVTVDSELSTTSENPVQNKVITAAIQEKLDYKTVSEDNLDTTYEYGTYYVNATNGSKLPDYEDSFMLVWRDDIYITQTVLSGNPDYKIYTRYINSGVVDGESVTWSDWSEITTGGVTVDTTITESSTNPVTSAAIYTALEDKIDSSEKGAANGVAPLSGSTKLHRKYLDIDSVLSSTSMNPVQNKVVNSAITTINTSIANADNWNTCYDWCNTFFNGFDSSSGYLSTAEIATDIGIISDLQTTATNLVDAVNEIKSSQTTGGVTIDSELSETSTNPVQNKVINTAINTVQSNVDDVRNTVETFCDSNTYVSVSEIEEAIDNVEESVQTAAAATGADKIYIDWFGVLEDGTSVTAYTVPDEANAYELTDGAVFYLYDGSGVFKQQLVNETDITLNINDTGAKTVAINGQTFTEVNTAGSVLSAIAEYLYNDVLKLVYSSSSDMLELQPVADYLAGYVAAANTTAKTISVTGYGDTLTDGRVIYAIFERDSQLTTDTTLQVNKLTAKKLKLSQTRLAGEGYKLIRLTYLSEYDAFIAADDESYKESSKWNFTTAPAQIGTWIDGTPVWRMAWQKAFADMTTDDFDLLVSDKCISLPLSATTGGTPFVLDSRCWLYFTQPSIIDDVPLTSSNGQDFEMTESDANRLDQENDGYFGYAIFVGEESEWTVN